MMNVNSSQFMTEFNGHSVSFDCEFHSQFIQSSCRWNLARSMSKELLLPLPSTLESSAMADSTFVIFSLTARCIP
jgi:hypothetical protein